MKSVLSHTKVMMLACLLVTGSTLAQTSDSIPQKRFKINGFPFVYYTPETSFSFGAAGLFTFNFKNDSIGARPSTLTPGAAYTLNNQVLFYVPFTLLMQNDNYRITGEIGYYKYTYFYYGTGNNIPSDGSSREQYDVSFPRLRLSLYKRLSKHIFAGLKYNFDDYFGLKYKADGQLIEKKPNGFDGGINSGAGVGAIFDSRDNIYYPRKGVFIEAGTTFDDPALGSNYRFSKTTLDGSWFRSLAPKSVLGLNAYIQYNEGQVPYYLLGFLGGSKRMRGIFEGRYRDKIALQAQAELRQEIFKNFGLVLFLGSGVVSNEFAGLRLDNLRFAGGTGLRYKLNKKEHINVRLDVGFSKYGILPYLTIGEAF